MLYILLVFKRGQKARNPPQNSTKSPFEMHVEYIEYVEDIVYTVARRYEFYIRVAKT